MHWIARVFVSAAVRRVAALLVVALLAIFGIEHSAAQTTCGPGGNCDQGTAYSACMTTAQSTVASSPAGSRNPSCPGPFAGAGNQYYQCSFESHVGGGTWVPQFCNAFYFANNKTCASRPDYNGAYPYQQFGQPRPGTMTCFNGCEESWRMNADGTANGTYATGAVCQSKTTDAQCKAEYGSDYYFNKHLSACEPDVPDTCPEGQEKNASGICEYSKCPAGKKLQADGTCINEKNECPAGNIKAPSGECLPGDGQCATGEAKGKDGTCKRDSNGDGVPDSEEGPDDPDKDSASGGDTCNAPPSCNGNPIMCAQLRTQWRIDCNTRKNRNIAGGHCGPGGVPVCTGDKCDAMEYAQLLQTWKASCALEKLAAGDGGGAPGSGDPDVKAIKDALTGAGGAPDIGPEGSPGDSWSGGSGGGTGSGEPDTAGYGWGSTCPTPPTIDLMGVSINLDVGPLCSWLALGSYFVLGLAALGSLRIVGGGIA